jgi:glycine cleavage system H protein
MSKVPGDLRYTKSHEWVQVGADGILTLGITDHAQEALGDLVYVEAPKKGRKLKAGEACAVVESVKAASDVYSPVSGEVVAGNEALAEAPEKLNLDPYGSWIMRIKPSNPAELDKLLDAKGYEQALAAEAH